MQQRQRRESKAATLQAQLLQAPSTLHLHLLLIATTTSRLSTARTFMMVTIRAPPTRNENEAVKFFA
jgi:hypothetical protein